jgi:osmotically-inducible protein OsmY
MLATQRKQVSHSEYFKCDDLSQRTVEEQRMHPNSKRIDASIAEKVDRALWKDAMLRRTDYREIHVAVKNGVVYLSGNVIRASNQERAEAAARTIPAVLGVMNYLVPDDKIIGEVAGALGKIEHEHQVKFFTGVQNGVVKLTGEVSSATVRSLAEKSVADIPGVRGVINSIRTFGVNLEPEDQRFLQPYIGEQIYFRDSLCVTVQKVIINPNNRRVVAMIVRGRFSNSQQNPGFLAYHKRQTAERLFAIPMSSVRNLAEVSGFLRINSTEAAGFLDFDPAGFLVPGEDWTPPYPYCRNDVLFRAESNKFMNQTEGELAFIPAIFPWITPEMQTKEAG